MRNIQIDMPHLDVIGCDNHDLSRHLQEKNRVRDVKQKSGNPQRQTARFTRVKRASCKNALVQLAQFIARPGLEDRIRQVCNRKRRLLRRVLRAWTRYIVFARVVDERVGGIEGDWLGSVRRGDKFMAIRNPTDIRCRREDSGWAGSCGTGPAPR